ncbi:MAG: PAS domain-containing protein [Symploca sp. SIO2G7]|nr:PAS domain-containing protein [Symploca sp. SIO2G7]
MSVAKTTIYLKIALEQLQQEIVKRKQVEKELRATQERFQYLIASNPAIIYSCHPDGDYSATFVSENSKDILGYTTQEWLADPQFWVSRIHPKDAPRIFASLSLLFEEGYHTHEYRFLHQDGTYRWLRDERRLVRDEAGNSLEIIGYLFDISDRKQLEKELQTSQQKYKTLFEIFPIGFSITDAVGNLLEANPALEEMLGRLSVVDREDKENAKTRRHRDTETRRLRDKGDKVRCKKGKKATEYQQQIICSNGKSMPVSELACKRALKENKIIKNVEMGIVKSQQETTWLNVTAAPIPLKNYGAVIAYVDITERKRVERIKDNFLVIASHELRTPLTSLRGSLGLLATGQLGNLTEQGQQLLEFALLDIERLMRLINDILDLKRMQSGNNLITLSRCQTNELIEQVRYVMQPIADDAEVTLAIATISKSLWANPDLIIQVLTNLLSNAIKFSPPGSTVWLNAKQQFFCGGDGEMERWGNKRDKNRFPNNKQQRTKDKRQRTIPTILFQVKDQGRGIPSDQLETIFEPFRQVDVSDSHQKEGTGLGLAICRSIVQQHGGRIWVESTLGVGSTFYFTLAMSPEHLMD